MFSDLILESALFWKKKYLHINQEEDIMATLKLGVICCLTMFSMDASLSFVNGSYPFNGLSHA